MRVTLPSHLARAASSPVGRRRRIEKTIGKESKADAKALKTAEKTASSQSKAEAKAAKVPFTRSATQGDRR